MSEQEYWLWSRGQAYVRVVPTAYRFLAFAIAAVQVFVFPTAYYSVIPPLILVTGVGIYTVVKALHPLRWHQASILGYSLLGVDITICILLVVLTGGLHSPLPSLYFGSSTDSSPASRQQSNILYRQAIGSLRNWYSDG